MADIFQELDEAVRREKAEKLWKEYGPTLIAAVIVLIASTAIATAYKTWDARRNMGETSKLMAAIEAENAIEALETFSKDSRPGQRTIARLTAAGQALISKDTSKALMLYQQVIEDGRAPDDFQDLARLMYVRVALSNDSPDAAALQEILEPVVKDQGGPWHWHALLESAVIKADIVGDYADAQKILTEIDPAKGAPQLMTQRARGLIQVYALRTPAQKAGETQ